MNIDRRPQPVIHDSLEMEGDAAAVLDGKMDEMTFAQLIGNTAMADPKSFARMQAECQADYRQDTMIPGAHLDIDNGRVTGITFERHDSKDDHFKSQIVHVGLSLPAGINSAIIDTDKHTSNMILPEAFKLRHPNHS